VLNQIQDFNKRGGRRRPNVQNATSNPGSICEADYGVDHVIHKGKRPSLATVTAKGEGGTTKSSFDHPVESHIGSLPRAVYGEETQRDDVQPSCSVEGG
tara:strand:+ start:1908 stop:2204 length:297 start_codon:yes stop_codon:yes gene_type:complete